MKFNDYLKKARERVGLTQDAAAFAIDQVSVNTIQNWEKGTIPDRIYWSSIIKIYGLNKEEFVRKLTNDIIPDENICNEEEICEFPDFLYSEDLRNKLNLTEEEQEFLGIEAIYNFEFITSGGDYLEIDIPNNLSLFPYDFIKQYGAFNILKMRNTLNERLGAYKNFVIKSIIEKPNNLFNVDYLSAEKCLKLSCIEEELKYEQYFKLFDLCGDDKIYLGKLKQEKKKSSYYNNYLDLTICSKKPKSLEDYALFVEESDSLHYFCKLHNYDKVSLCGYQKYYNLIVFEENPEEYLSMVNSYLELGKDISSIERKYILYAVLTEDGKRFYNWYNKYIKENNESKKDKE